MMEFCCGDCGRLLEIKDSVTIASSTMIKIDPCPNCDDNRCIKDTCDRFTELKDELQDVITQQKIDIEGNDEMIGKIRTLSKKWGGLIQEEINKILEGEE